MRTALKPNNEASRLAALHRYGVLDTVQEQAFDDITALASNICGTPFALITFVDADRLWIKSGIGISTSETARDIAFCSPKISELSSPPHRSSLASQRRTWKRLRTTASPANGRPGT